MSIQFDYQRVNSRESIDQAKAPDHHSGANSVRTSGYFEHGSPSKPMVARPDPVVKVYFSERNTAGGGVELEAFSRRERSGSLLPKSRAKPRDLVADGPLSDLTDRVQYPLATPSKHDLPL